MVTASTLMYESSLTMLILRPRASRMAPRESEAMPLPSEETTRPVTKTNRFIVSHRRLNVCVRPTMRGQSNEANGNNGNSTGVQISRSARARQIQLGHKGGVVPRYLEPRRVCGCAPARIQPQIGNGNQFVARKHQRQGIAHPRQHAKRLTQMLHGLRFSQARRPQGFPSLAPSHDEGGRQPLRVNAAALRDPAQISEPRPQLERRSQCASPRLCIRQSRLVATVIHNTLTSTPPSTSPTHP